MLKPLALAVVALASISGWAMAQDTKSPVVAAAASVQFALSDIADAYRQETGREIRMSFGSSGNLSRQIRQGAPFELFLSADESFVLDLAADGLTREEGAIYAVGRIGIMVAEGSVLTADGTLEDLRRALDDGRLRRFAIANPEHAPYGQRAREALEHAGLWEAIQPRLVIGENIAQAAQFSISSNADGGIVAESLALSPQMQGRGSFMLIPEGWHSPLRQRMALLKDAGPEARAFYDFLQGPTARAIFRRFGFLLPGETG